MVRIVPSSFFVIMQVEAVRQLDNLIEHCRSRLAVVTAGLPGVLWWVLAFSALLNIILIWMQDLEIHVHLVLGGVLPSILGALILLIAALDNPFRGEVNVGPEPFMLAYETVMKVEPPATLPRSPLLAPKKTLALH